MGCQISSSTVVPHNQNDKYCPDPNYAEENLENFMTEALIFGNRADAVKKFLQNDGALFSFMSFLKAEHYDVDIFDELVDIVESDQDVEKAAIDLVNKYKFPELNKLAVNEPSRSVEKLLISNSSKSKVMKSQEYHEDILSGKEELQTNIVNLLSKASTLSHRNHPRKNNPDICSTAVELKDTYSQVQQQVLFMIAMDTIPRYLQSDYYKLWRKQELDSNNYNSSQLILSFENDYTKSSSEPLLISDPEKNSSSSNNIRKAFAALDPLEVPIVARSSFLTVFLGSVEALPVAVSLSTANPNRPGFPLIYVNAIFEEITGYTRKEIIGRNCRFLQAGKAEMDSIAKLTRALAGAKPVKVEITNYRKNGEPFRNLLAMKPIFDQNGKYAYVVGLQFDVSNEESASLPKLQYIDYLLSMLPDRLPFDDKTNE